MTTRSRFDQRRREARSGLIGRLAGRAFSRRTSGLDGLAKKLMASQAPPADHDPELDHPDPDWLVPGPAQPTPTPTRTPTLTDEIP